MFDQEKAVSFVQSEGDALAQAKLAWIVEEIRPSYTATFQLFEDQRHDGGFAPFWAPDASSVDATCYRLAQAESLGLEMTDKHMSAALRFLNAQQRPSGQISEDPRLADAAPPWAKPGIPQADLYLTANAGFWLAQTPNLQLSAKDAAAYIKQFLKMDTGQIPTFLNGYWLTVGLWWLVGEREAAKLLLDHLQTRLEEMPASNLVWMLNTFRIAKIPKTQAPIPAAVARLMGMQEENGRFPSDEGQHIQLTLDALYALNHYQQERKSS